jgi:hypothetical protein
MTMTDSSSSIPASGRLRQAYHSVGRWPLKVKVAAGFAALLLFGGTAYAASSWIAGLNAGSSAQAQSGSVQNVTITAIATPGATNLLYPGGTGDAVAKISNPNNFPVTVTGVNLPTSTTYAGGFSDNGLSIAQTGCSTTTSLVSWAFATGTAGSAHTLTTPITVAANGNITINFTNNTTMALAAPTACQSTYFSMPSFTGVVATAGAATITAATTDSWTS